jgi:hypothetical protein
MGVNFDKQNLLFRANIVVNRKLKFLGYFDNSLEAAMAYDIACIHLFEEFARPNYPAAAYGLGEW